MTTLINWVNFVIYNSIDLSTTNISTIDLATIGLSTIDLLLSPVKASVPTNRANLSDALEYLLIHIDLVFAAALIAVLVTLTGSALITVQFIVQNIVQNIALINWSLLY